MVGAWTNPENHTFWANGNPLIWENVYRANLTDQLVRNSCGLQLPDNFGIAWGSGVFGPEVIAHVVGACDIYEHSGNMTFLREAYRFYKDFFWNGICGTHWNYAYDAVLCLNKMATLTGTPEDATHWNDTVRPRMREIPRILQNNFVPTPSKDSDTIVRWTKIA